LLLLHSMEDSLQEGEAYRTFTKRDPETGEVIVYGEPSRGSPTSEWGIVIGDIVHNLRSALDHMVWQLTVAQRHVPPPRISGKWRDIAFPVFTKDPRKKNEDGKHIPWQVEPPKSLWGVHASLLPEFERLQPFMRRENLVLVQQKVDDPSHAPLAILNNLWNIDKHRHINLAIFNVGYKDLFGSPPVARIPEGVNRLNFVLNPKGSFEGRTEFGRLSWAGGPVPPEIVRYLMPTVFFDIAFESGPPAYGAQVTQLLDGLYDEVATILRRFERHLP
jgi:hypothetical protein